MSNSFRSASALFVGRFVVVIAALSAGCVTESAPAPEVVNVPASVERFIESPGTLSADRIIVDAVSAYRGDMVPIIDKDMHTRTITPNKIELVNNADRGGTPVVVTFRQMRLEARQHLEVRFFEPDALKNNPHPVVLRIVGDGLAHVKGAGTDVIAERLVIENEHLHAFDAQGKETKSE